MGWSGGTEIADGVWDVVKQYIPEENKKEVAIEIIALLEDQDWDNLGESEELYEISGRKAIDEAEEADWVKSMKEKNL